MKRIISVAFILFFLLLAFLFSLLDTDATVDTSQTLRFDDVAHIRQIARDNNPKTLKPGEIRNILIDERDLNLLLNYSAKRYGDIRVRATLQPNLIELHGSVALPFSLYLNYHATLGLRDNAPYFLTLKLGYWQLPTFSLPLASRLLHNQLGVHILSYKHIWQAVQGVDIRHGEVSVRYRWSPKLLQEITKQSNWILFEEDDLQRIAVYQRQIAQWSLQRPGRWGSLHHLLKTLFKTAQSRSLGGEDAAAENRALLYSVALYVVNTEIVQLLPDDLRREIPAKRISLLLGSRQDLSQHFVISGAVTVSAGSGLADAVGVFKEVHDAHDGSGFSFADLLADRAGTRFATLATESRRSARRVQDFMVNSTRETEYMPTTSDLPEGIMELEFKSRYEDLDSQAYQLVESEIQRRISTCKIYDNN
ncbi:MAG: hypothetical protein OEW58_00490 [Gammaproteobacteria bacterium]|nr:hypothetical protein [Gammaproteobacteria bacterium]